MAHHEEGLYDERIVAQPPATQTRPPPKLLTGRVVPPLHRSFLAASIMRAKSSKRAR